MKYEYGKETPIYKLLFNINKHLVSNIYNNDH